MECECNKNRIFVLRNTPAYSQLIMDNDAKLFLGMFNKEQAESAVQKNSIRRVHHQSSTNLHFFANTALNELPTDSLPGDNRYGVQIAIRRLVSFEGVRQNGSQLSSGGDFELIMKDLILKAPTLQSLDSITERRPELSILSSKSKVANPPIRKHCSQSGIKVDEAHKQLPYRLDNYCGLHMSASIHREGNEFITQLTIMGTGYIVAPSKDIAQEVLETESLMPLFADKTTNVRISNDLARDLTRSVVTGESKIAIGEPGYGIKIEFPEEVVITCKHTGTAAQEGMSFNLGMAHNLLDVTSRQALSMLDQATKKMELDSRVRLSIWHFGTAEEYAQQEAKQKVTQAKSALAQAERELEEAQNTARRKSCQ